MLTILLQYTISDICKHFTPFCVKYFGKEGKNDGW